MTTVERNKQPYEDVLGTIGWTPLIRLNRVTQGIRTPVFGKAEIFNPGGSVKDRIGLPIVRRAEQSGALKKGGTIVEATSGNTGIGLALAAAIRGYRCIFTMPDKMSQEKARLLRAYGAEVIITPTAVGVMMTSAPNARSSRAFSCDILSGIVKMHRYPLTAAAIARPTPVFPDVASTIRPPGLSLPARSAASIIASPIRSLTDPPGLKNSALA